MLGVQAVWTIEMSQGAPDLHGRGRQGRRQLTFGSALPTLRARPLPRVASPYLLELGLSKSLMSLVFVAGALSAKTQLVYVGGSD